MAGEESVPLIKTTESNFKTILIRNIVLSAVEKSQISWKNKFKTWTLRVYLLKQFFFLLTSNKRITLIFGRLVTIPDFTKLIENNYFHTFNSSIEYGFVIKQLNCLPKPKKHLVNLKLIQQFACYPHIKKYLPLLDKWVIVNVLNTLH